MTAHIVHHLHPRIPLDRTPAALRELYPILKRATATCWIATTRIDPPPGSAGRDILSFSLASDPLAVTLPESFPGGNDEPSL